MKTPILVILLGFFLLAFLGLQPFINTVMDAEDVRVVGVPLLGAGFKGFLGVGIVFLEFAIIFFSLLDRIGDTIKAVLKPVASLMPLGMFVFAAYQTFAPIFFSLVPGGISAQIGDASIAAEGAGISGGDYFASAVNTPAFTRNVVFTVVAMLLFVVVSRFASQPANLVDELRRLRAENERFRKMLQ